MLTCIKLYLTNNFFYKVCKKHLTRNRKSQETKNLTGNRKYQKLKNYNKS